MTEPFDRKFAESISKLSTRIQHDVAGYDSREIGTLVKDMLKEIDRLNGVPVSLELCEPVIINGTTTEGRVTELADGKVKVFYFNRVMQREEEHWFALPNVSRPKKD